VTQNQPQVDLSTLFLSISSAACMGLGLTPPPPGEDAEVNLDLARQNIDLLELLKLKTAGNRTDQEDQLIDQLLFEIRMQYVEVEKSQKG
jgi:hypothetical protein